MSEAPNQPIPVMEVGRYAGRRVDTLPLSYLRWVISQDFSKDILECAIEKLKNSEYNDLPIDVSRHAIDMFSKRFLALWVGSEGKKEEGAIGLASFIAILAQEAWEKGEDVSKYRHQDDGVVKRWKDIKWVFGVNPNYPDYLSVITVMDSSEH